MGNICRTKRQIINAHSIAGFVPGFLYLETINCRVLFCLVFLFECKHVIPVLYILVDFIELLLFGIDCNYFRIYALFPNSDGGNCDSTFVVGV